LSDCPPSTTTAVRERPGPGESAAAPPRVAGLDGLRGLCALYVLLFHCWAYTFHGSPPGSGPVWLGWLGFGRLAVVLFLILSGFSLAVSPAGRGWQLGGVPRFARRRAWRILPPYWAALAFSLVIAWTVVRQPHSGPPTAESVLVHGLLLQDVVSVPTPNGAFWSISVEALLYLAFPLMLAVCRRAGVATMLACATVPVVTIGALVFGGSSPDGANRLAPQLLPVFAAGIAAAGIVAAGDRIRRLPWPWLSVAAAVPAAALVLHQGSSWTVHHYFWVDLAVAPALAMLVVAVATARPRVVTRLLSTRPLVRLGSCSYSLYLIHLPIVVAISLKVVTPRLGYGLPAFAATTAIALPLSLISAWLFAQVFEFPFQRHRSWAALTAAVRARRWWTDQPGLDSKTTTAVSDDRSAA
jgi:peptidoglycan/LPS O-acetylase OafA/YrhL